VPSTIPSFSRLTATLTQPPSTTTSGNNVVHTDTSPGARSSRQSNEPNDSADHNDAANSEINIQEGDPLGGDLVPSKQYFFLRNFFTIQNIHLSLL